MEKGKAKRRQPQPYIPPALPVYQSRYRTVLDAARRRAAAATRPGNQYRTVLDAARRAKQERSRK